MAIIFLSNGSDSFLGDDAGNLIHGGAQPDPTLDAGRDSLTGGTGADTIIGYGARDTIRGGQGGDLIMGSDGADNLHGLFDGPIQATDGNDTIIGGDETAFGPGIGFGDGIDGNRGNDSLVGGRGFESIQGGEGNDTVRGGGEGDLITGEDGNDLLYGDDVGADAFGAGEAISGGNGNDTVWGGEGNDILTGNADRDSLIGGRGNDNLDGGDGNDTLVADAGDDTLTGGLGNDLYVNASGLDVIVENAGEGRDTLRSAFDVDLLYGADIELIQLTGVANRNVIANDVAQELRGNAGNNRLDARGADDLLRGGAGNDTLLGGLGRDKLYGDEGADHFAWTDLAESPVATRDNVYDFDAAGGDRINLSTIDANPFTVGDEAFVWRGSLSFLGGGVASARVVVSASGTILQLDTGDKVVDAAIFIVGVALTQSDVIL